MFGPDDPCEPNPQAAVDARKQTNNAATPRVRLIAPYDFIGEVGDPLNVWQLCFTSSDLTDAAKAFLAYLRAHTDHDIGYAFPGIARAANDLGKANKTILLLRDEAQAAGFLHFEKGRRGRYNPGRYWPTIPDFDDSAVIVSHAKQMSKPAFVSHAKQIAKLLFVSKRGAFVSKTRPIVSPSGNENREQRTTNAHGARATKRARADARAGANGRTEIDAAAEAIKDTTIAIAKAAHCTSETIQLTLCIGEQLNLRRAWQSDPAKAQNSPEYLALTKGQQIHGSSDGW